ncbi:sestrin-2 isoform X2 [Scleropages formosus]|uniref:Sestrin 2 n=1 Tax=Scleropages formosus TaxID=113540 RepID=A0A8C9SAX5_SCLFO|nr:sestrin-2-like isoform X2 [Scleropages formosus]
MDSGRGAPASAGTTTTTTTRPNGAGHEWPGGVGGARDEVQVEEPSSSSFSSSSSSLPEPSARPRRLSRLCSRDTRERAEALNELARGALCRDTLLQLLRVSRTCPMEDVRRGAAELLGAAQDAGVEVPRALVSGPSAFIPPGEVWEEGAGLPELVETFRSMGRVDHVITVMALHPSYLSCFLHTQQALLQLDGPLPQPWRHYIIVMAASRHRCSYLVHLHSSWFLETGGEERWLGGLHRAPPKLRRLSLLNKLLAHRPWLITQEHIADLVCPSSEERWSLAELIQAVILLTYAHSLSCFVWGCGINPELDFLGGHAFQPPSPSARSSHSPLHEGMGDSQSGSDMDTEVERLMKRMQLLLEQNEEFSQEEMVTRFEKERSEMLLEAPCDDAVCAPPDVSHFVEDPEFTYQDFAPRGEQSPPTLRAQDYSWEDHGFSLMNRLYPDMGQLLDEKFQVVLGLTYHTMAMHRDVDTTMLRKAVWNYIHCVFGIRYDDYDYGDVNQLLELSLKVYIKTVACHPEKTTLRMYTNFWKHFCHSEKVHVNLLLLEARLQAALLYALRAITRYMT